MMFYGCEISQYDSRDYTLNSQAKSSDLPDSFTLDHLARVKNQSNVSSCVAHAMSSILEWHDYEGRELSTNFIYGMQRQLFSRESKGMYLRDACKIVRTYGDMLEEDCQSNTEVPDCFSIAEDAFLDHDKLLRAEEFRVSSYYKCNTVKDIKYALYNHGPVLAAIRWYNNYTTDDEGVLVGDESGEYGNHAIMIYGYNEKGFLCQNSWGYKWGNYGRFILPYSIKVREARGFVDWDGESDLSKPSEGSIWITLYKILNSIINFIMKLKKD